MTATRTDSLASVRPVPHLRRASTSALGYIAHLRAVAQQRRQLRAMTDAQLRDIGLTRGEAQSEAGRSFWDAPAYFFERRY